MLQIKNRSGRFKMGRRLNTITNTTLASATFNGNGVTTAFATGFQFLQNADLRVVETSSTGVETVKTLTTHYTVTGAGNPSGGTVTMLVAPATGTKLNINSNVTLDQQTDYQEGGSFAASTHETALDKLTKAVQQVKEITDRSLKLPVSNQSITAQTPVVTADYVLGVNSAGTALEWKSPSTIALGSTVSAYAETLLDDADATEARTTLGVGTIATQAANNVSITGGSVSGITDLALADGGTGASLVDPNADRILFWDDSAGQVTWLAPTGNIAITGTTIDATSTLDINGLSAIGAAVDGANDQLPIYDSSATANRKVTLNSLITDLTEDASPDSANDLVMTYDSSATQVKKVKLQNLAGSSGRTVLLQTNTSSSSAISEFNGLFSSAYDMYMFEFLDVLPATDGVLLSCQVGTGGTPTYITANYKWAVLCGEGNAGYQNTTSTSDSLAYLTPNGRSTTYIDNSATTAGVSGFLKVFGGDTTSRVTKGVGELCWLANGGSEWINSYPTFYQPAATITAIKFYFSSGNIASGKIRMYGIKNS